jgi:hypothetical protein
MMPIDNLLRYIVKVPAGDSLTDAVAQHRDRTGHNGMCVLVFERVPMRGSKRFESRLFERNHSRRVRKANSDDANCVTAK